MIALGTSSLDEPASAYHRDSAFLDDRTRDATAQSSATTRDDEGYGHGGSSFSLGMAVCSTVRCATYSGLRFSSLFIVDRECGVVCDSAVSKARCVALKSWHVLRLHGPTLIDHLYCLV
jgi:hypothetical protein